MLQLKRVRLARGLSLVKLCILTGIDPGNLSRLETGKIYPYPGWRKRIAAALQMPEEELFREVVDDAQAAGR